MLAVLAHDGAGGGCHAGGGPFSASGGDALDPGERWYHMWVGLITHPPCSRASPAFKPGLATEIAGCGSAAQHVTADVPLSAHLEV